MKYLILIILILQSLLLFSNPKDVFIATGEYPPYTSSEYKNYGFCAEICTEAFKAVGINTKYVFFPWNRTENLLKNGKVFAALPYAKTDERSALYYFSDPILDSKALFFYLKDNKKIPDNFAWNSMNDFNPFIMGGLLGYWYVDNFEKNKLNVVYSISDVANFSNLINRRVDFILITDQVGWHIIRKNFPDHLNKIKTLPKPESNFPFHLMISKSYPDYKKLTTEFNRGLKIIKKNGTFAKISEKY
jgi:polar amino acid transport system substrate-binding protein